jgi:hypothetical protein
MFWLSDNILAMDYLIEVRDASDSMQLAEEDWRYLLMLAGTLGWKPVAGLAYYLSVPPPDIIPVSISRHLAETLNRIVPTLPERSGPINLPLSQEGVSFMDLRNYFGGERKRVVEESIQLCQLGDLTVRRTWESGP